MQPLGAQLAIAVDQLLTGLAADAKLGTQIGKVVLTTFDFNYEGNFLIHRVDTLKGHSSDDW